MMKTYLQWLCLAPLLALIAIGCDSATESAKTPDTPAITSPPKSETSEAPKKNMHTVDLLPQMVYGGSTKTATAKVDVTTEVSGEGLKFWMTRKDPRLGDFAAFSFTIEGLTPGQGYVLNMDLLSPYMRSGAQGNILYQVMKDFELLLSEDVADTNKVNNIKISWKADKPEASFTIHSIAIKNCGASDWGKFASPLIVKSISYEADSGVNKLTVEATSPFTTIE